MTDQDLIQKLNQLKSEPAGGNPDRNWVVSNKEILMSQIRPWGRTEQVNMPASDRVYYWQYFNQLFRQRVLQPALATTLVIVVLLGYTATVSVANASLPGDALYPVKIAKERVQLAFTLSDSDKVKLQITFIARRSNELQQLAASSNNSHEKKERIDQTAKRITAEVKAVKDKLNKISFAAITNKAEIVEIAKVVDTKTLEIQKSIAAANQNLSAEVQGQVAAELKIAINTVEEAGASALGVIIDEYESGQVNDNETATRVMDRIKNAEDKVANIAAIINEISTSTVVSLAAGQITATTSTLAIINGGPQTANQVIQEAKDLLSGNNFSAALGKVVEVDSIIDGLKAIVEELIGGAVLGESATSTDSVINGASATSAASSSAPGVTAGESQ